MLKTDITNAGAETSTLQNHQCNAMLSHGIIDKTSYNLHAIDDFGAVHSGWFIDLFDSHLLYDVFNCGQFNAMFTNLFLPTFPLSFYSLLRQQSLVWQSYNNRTIICSEKTMLLDHIRSSFIKTMSTAEFNVISSNLDSNILVSYLFLGFQFFVLIVFMNVLVSIG